MRAARRMCLALLSVMAGCSESTAADDPLVDPYKRPTRDAAADTAADITVVDAEAGASAEAGKDVNTAEGGASGCSTPAITGANPNWRGIYFGTLHDHTSWSLDAYYKGTAASAGPDEAFQFAAGKISAWNGVKLSKPLDWAAITDHSEFFDQMYGCHFNDDKGSTTYKSSFCRNARTVDGFGYKRQSELIGNPPKFVCQESSYEYGCPEKGSKTSDGVPITECTSDYGTTDCDGMSKTMWDKSQQIADRHNESGLSNGCTFATLNAFEYSSNMRVPDGTTMNLHRNIIFRGSNQPRTTPHPLGAAESKVTKYPIDFIAYNTPTKLWKQLEAECVADPTDGSKPCKAMAIPHNPNDSAGLKWDISGKSGDGETDNGLLRSKFERLVEVFQHKGQSECLNASATGVDGKDGYDAFCEFELGTTTTGETNSYGITGLPNRKTDRPGYARAGLSKGILEYYKNGYTLNPIQLGLTASLDSHNATPGYTPEKGFVGNTAGDDDSPEKRTAVSTGSGPSTSNNPQRYWNAGGLTAVHARANTREEIYDGLYAREAYGTSGTRILLWFFLLGENDTTDYCNASGGGYFTPELAAQVRKNGGIPMGGEFSVRRNKHVFLVAAQKDTSFSATSGMDAHNIYEIDLVQSYVLSGGDAGSPSTKEAIFRYRGKIGSDAGPVENENGYPALCTIFTDNTATPFVATDGVTKLTDALSAPASYWYARVLETKTRSWRYYDCEDIASRGGACPVDFTGEGPDANGKYIDNKSYKNPWATIHERAWSSPIWLMTKKK